MSDRETADRLKRRIASLEALRQPHEGEWWDCFRYTYPERGGGLNGSDPTSVANGAKAANAEIFDDTAKDGTRVLGASFASGLTPANSQWFGLDTGGNESDEEARWLSDAAQFLFDNIHGANFDAASMECHLDMAAGPGMFVLYIDEAPTGGYRFEQWPFSQCFVSSSVNGGPVDTIYRRFEMTVEQAVAYYGLQNVSQRTRERYERKELDHKITIVWAIEPRASYSGPEGARLARNKPFASCHLELEEVHVAKESGYDEFPCCVPRWLLVPGTHYARGPMSAVLATVKTLNEIQRLELVNLEMSAYGMFKATDDGVLNPFTTTIGPRRVVVVADMDNFEPIKAGGDFNVSFAKKEDMQRAVRKLLLADQLQPQDGPAMTATEVHARIMLIRQQLGPIFGRLQAEWLRPLVERCFGIAFRAGALAAACGPIPQSLLGKNVTVSYQSPLARAQKLEEVVAIDQWVGGIVSYAAATGRMEELDEIDTVEINKFKRDALGVPSKAQRTPEMVAQVRQQRAEAQKAAQAQEQQAQIQTTAGEAAAKNMAMAA